MGSCWSDETYELANHEWEGCVEDQRHRTKYGGSSQSFATFQSRVVN